MNKNALLSMLALNGENAGDLAVVLRKNKSTVSAKINGKRDFTQGELETIIHRYGLSPEQTFTIFFE